VHAQGEAQPNGPNSVVTDHESLGRFHWIVEESVDGVTPELIFTDNETNARRLFNAENMGPYVKDAFDDYIVHERAESDRPARLWHQGGGALPLHIPAGAQSRRAVAALSRQRDPGRSDRRAVRGHLQAADR